ncbi:MAG: hypothetical protein FJZ90_17395, partial [Chloroflexi bacterium]|nr:hypothetical protein [Chloroflexota bacterium]
MATTRPVGRLPGPITRLVSARLGLALALILAAALGLRLYRIGHQSLWNDEGTSVALAQRDLLAITRDASHDIHPPLYYYLLHIWLRLFGTGEPAARSLSAVAGTALVGVTYGLSRRFWGERAALLAALLAALAPFQVYYSQEARMYILAALLGALSMWAYDRWIERALPSGRSAPGRLVAYVAVSALALYSHYFAATLILAQNLATLVFALSGRAGAPTIEGPLHLRPMQRLPVRTLGTWALSQVAIALFYLPWLALSWRSLRNWPAVSAPMSLGTLLHRLARLLPLGVIAAQEPQALALGVALSALAVVGLVLSGANARVSAPVRRGSWVVGLYLLAPIAAIYLLSLNRPMYKDKFLLLVSPAFGILQARGIVALAGLVGAGRSPGHRLASGVLGLVLAAAAIVPSTQGLRRLYS